MIACMAHVQGKGCAQFLFNGTDTGERANRAWPLFKADTLYCEPDDNPCRISFHPHGDAGQGKFGPVRVPEIEMFEPWPPVAEDRLLK